VRPLSCARLSIGNVLEFLCLKWKPSNSEYCNKFRRLVWVIVICAVLLIIPSCKCAINPIGKPSPVYSHSSRDNDEAFRFPSATPYYRTGRCTLAFGSYLGRAASILTFFMVFLFLQTNVTVLVRYDKRTSSYPDRMCAFSSVVSFSGVTLFLKISH
jgi:hypothetical protein